MLRRMMLAAPLAMIAGLAAMGPASAEEQKTPRVLTLSGRGEVKAVPDLAVVTAGVSVQADTAAAALAGNTSAMSRVMQALRTAGIAEKDIQTSNFSVQPRYDYSNNQQPPRLSGYEVANGVTVIVRKTGELGALLDSLVSGGANQIGGISFQVADPQAALDEARRRAVADATRKAKLYADAAGVTLGPILSLSEGGGFEPPVPYRVKGMAAQAADGAPPVSVGEQTLAVDVNIAWEIR